MTDIDRANQAQAIQAIEDCYAPAKKTTAQEMEELLPVLRRFGVSEYNNDVHGVRIKFAERPALEMAQQPSIPLPPGIAPGLAAAFGLATGNSFTTRTEPPPPVGSVEPLKLDLDEVLFGAK